MQATTVQIGNLIDYTPGADVAAGDVVVQGDLVGVATRPIAANALGALNVEGIFDFAKTGGAGVVFAVGDIAYWDDAANKAVTTSAGGVNKRLGPVVAAAVDAATSVRVKLTPPGSLLEPLARAIADPGNVTKAIPVTNSGTCQLVTAGAETRTVAAPSFVGQLLLLTMKTDGGDCVVTIATTINQTGNNTITFNDAGDAVLLVAKQSGANIRWSVVVNDGAALSTV